MGSSRFRYALFWHVVSCGLWLMNSYCSLWFPIVVYSSPRRGQRQPSCLLWVSLMPICPFARPPFAGICSKHFAKTLFAFCSPKTLTEVGQDKTNNRLRPPTARVTTKVLSAPFVTTHRFGFVDSHEKGGLWRGSAITHEHLKA